MKRLAAFAVLALALLGAVLLWTLPRGSRPTGDDRPTFSTSAASNVLLITIDTLRADALGVYGNSRARTPAMDALAREGVLFERAFAVAPITLPSHASMLTGLYPPGHGARHNGIRMREDVRTLPEVLAAAGRRTGAFVSAFPLDRSFGLARGFETYADRMPRGPDGRPANERAGHATVDEAIAWLNRVGTGRFFAWVHLFEPHAPYGDVESGRPIAERYGDEVTEADRQVGRLLDALGDRRRDTIVAIAGDHGEAFGEHGEIAHSIFVYDTTLRVPLIIAGPGITAGRDTRAVSLVDLAPTIAALSGVSGIDADGSDLRVRESPPAQSGARALYAESFAPLVDFGWASLRALRAGKWKYVAAPRPELYDLDNDPGEERNVIGDQSAVAADLATRVDRISPPELPATASTAMDPDARRRLQALGYASGARSGSDTRRDPKDARALAAAIASMLSGELRGAALERTLRAVLAEDPGNPQANLRLAYLRLESGRCDQAETLFARAVEHGVAGADAHLGLATCMGRRGAVADALRALEDARAREPQNAVVIANIGIAQAALGRHDRAAATLRAALAIDAELHEARFNLALAYARGGDRESAAREARALLERLPQDAPQRAEVERLLQALK